MNFISIECAKRELIHPMSSGVSHDSLIIIIYRVQKTKNVVAGWGRTEELDTANAQGFDTSAAYEQNLQKLELEDIFEGTDCGQKFKGLGKKGLGHDRILCARAKFEEDKPKDACSGDSGGPIFSSAGLNDQSDSKYLRGILSLGSTKCGSVSYVFMYILIHTNIDINI